MADNKEMSSLKQKIKKHKAKINSILFVIFVISNIGFLQGEIYNKPKKNRIIYEKRFPLYNVEKFMVDDSGNYYIATEFKLWIQVFDKDGHFLYTVGTYANSVYDFYLDSEGLLNIVIPIRDDERFALDIIDLEKGERVYEGYKSGDYVRDNTIATNGNSYELDYDKVIINGEKIVELEDVPRLPLPSRFYSSLIGICLFGFAVVNNDFLGFFNSEKNKK